MSKYRATDTRHGIYDNKSKQFVSKSGIKCLTFWDTLRNRYTTAVDYFVREV